MNVVSGIKEAYAEPMILSEFMARVNLIPECIYDTWEFQFRDNDEIWQNYGIAKHSKIRKKYGLLN